MEPITFTLSDLTAFGIFEVFLKATLMFGFVLITFVMILFASPKLEKIFKIDEPPTANTPTHKSEDTPQKIKIGRAIIALFLLFYMSTYLIPQFFDFHHVNILQDGTWKLKNRWGITVGNIGPTNNRNIETTTIQTKFTRYRPTNNRVIVISTDNKAYKSVYDTDTALKKVQNELRVQAQKQQVLANYTTEIKFPEKIIQIISIGVILLAGWWFWRK